MSRARPQSAQHTKTGFGEFHMSKKLDIIPKVTNYRIDGSGRDSYINFNNGGNTRPSNELGLFNYSTKRGLNSFNAGKSYNVIPKVTIYKSDGMGRDQYIVLNCGGFYNSGGNVNNHNFKTTLRNYDVKPTKTIFNDFSLTCKNHLIKSVQSKISEESKKQRLLSARLSVPKRVYQKYNNNTNANYNKNFNYSQVKLA